MFAVEQKKMFIELNGGTNSKHEAARDHSGDG